MMDPSDWPRLVYLAVIVAALLGAYLLASRRNIRKFVTHSGFWLFAFIGTVVVFGLWDDIRNTAMPRSAVVSDEKITLRREYDGHFYSMVRINGEPIRFLVDTGASELVLSKPDAEAVGLDIGELQFWGRASTANGEVRTASATLSEVRLGSRIERNFRASVNEGEMDISLLGQSYLRGFAKIEIAGDTMSLHF